jgi:transposase
MTSKWCRIIGLPINPALSRNPKPPPLGGGVFTAHAVLANKGYDADYVVKQAIKMGAVAVIPPKKNRCNPREYDKHLYKERNQIERLSNRLKQWRRIATRYDKTACSFRAFVTIAAITLWLK